MAVTAALIKELRELSGAGMSDCKKALDETNGDIQAATKYLREKGLAAAAKKSGRIAAEGVVAAIVKDSKAIVLEVNCETDFVAINPGFKEYVNQVAEQALDSSAETVEVFLDEKWSLDPSLTVKDELSNKVATIGEKLSIRRFTRYEKNESGIISSYVHGGGKIGVILDINCASDDEKVAEMGKNLCMQIAALFPKYVKREDIPGDFIENEREILTHQAQNDEKDSKKPAAVIEKMIEGRLTKNLKELCLLDQEYVKDTSMTVKQYVDSVAKEVGSAIELVRFTCYEKGAGIEKKEEDFAAEVQKAMES